MTEPNSGQEPGQQGEQQGEQQSGQQSGGEQSEGTGQESSTQSQQGNQGNQGNQGGQQQGNQDGQGSGQQRGGGGLTQEATAAELAEARREAARYRNERNTFQQQFDQLRNGLQQALGLGDQGNQDPDQLQSQLNQTQANFRRERLQNVALTQSLQHGADPALTWAHLFASGALDDVDINDAGLVDAVGNQVQAAMQANPKLRADFEAQAQTQNTENVGGGSNPPSGGEDPLPDVNPWKQETFNLTEQARITTETPDLANRLKRAAGIRS